MRVVHVRVSQAEFGKVFAAMRDWLDLNNYRLGRFETESADDGSIIIKAQFDDDDMAERFRSEFGGGYAA